MDPAAETHAVPPPGAVTVTVEAAVVAVPAPPTAAARPARGGAAARRARSTRCARAALVMVLFVLGFAAAALGLFAMNLPSADSRTMGPCAPTDAEAAGLRAASQLLLLAASAQVLAATAAVLVPTVLFVLLAYALGWLTAYHAMDVVWMLVACHGRVHGALAFHFWFFYAVVLAALLVGCFVVHY